MTTLLERPILPSADDAELAAQASRQLSRAKHEGAELRVQVDGGEVLRLPKAVSELLYHLLTEMAQGNAVTLVPIHAELTTQEAADYLNVSRPYLIRLLEEGKVKFNMVGTHRRIKFGDLEAFRKSNEDERKRVMDDLAAQAQELGMGY
ncbi:MULTISPECIES: helix-turn-helix domain-containing protein [unclassified Mesorhizobium]|uniref:helix-turn-helix domain-containing protein n=1 Tax=unclassified Mesorhizobium TaxID=325217 RepID=UPI000FD861F4|nr:MULTISPECIES: helix-turn-helix domain-containing protein [unclassified Mesorhizobium]TGQ34266.1 helix-turn-helix domain-containing protein [Mesorhizobium sp. M00.F.Ca.ET.216.01.1.1]TIS54727.1 MAG: helix-turn-helix domain-containing protein [Mesorhizobium sp.]TIS88759.1 MAG: helix-turn-helix domain-containing protein [Mesorhizobium sp.]TJW06782.1 MAG: helix-turn-helix domain-containing protein [Mesorhizobium sp.]TJW47836.1 MAG: helix-turn-helix domain-containing protein [Mesorhizobium sp.]